jgi:hypothetical protein
MGIIRSVITYPQVVYFVRNKVLYIFIIDLSYEFKRPFPGPEVKVAAKNSLV